MGAASESLRQSLGRLVDSFSNVFTLQVDPNLSEDENVERIVGDTALVAACVACLQPVPAADFLVFAPLQTKMALHIGHAKGFDVSQERAQEIVREVLGAVWLSVASQLVIGGVLKLLPAGGLLTFPLNYAATWGIGEVVNHYFDVQRLGETPDASSMKAVFRTQFKEGKRRAKALDRDALERKAEELRQKVAARDPNLTTQTRLRPRERPPQRPTAPGVEGTGRALKIEVRPKDAVEPPPPSTPPAAKTIGPLPNDLPDDPPGDLAEAPPPAEEAAAKTLGGGEDVLARLERLAALHQAGALDDEEYALAKRALLG